MSRPYSFYYIFIQTDTQKNNITEPYILQYTFPSNKCDTDHNSNGRSCRLSHFKRDKLAKKSVWI